MVLTSSPPYPHGDIDDASDASIPNAIDGNLNWDSDELDMHVSSLLSCADSFDEFIAANSHPLTSNPMPSDSSAADGNAALDMLSEGIVAANAAGNNVSNAMLHEQRTFQPTFSPANQQSIHSAKNRLKYHLWKDIIQEMIKHNLGINVIFSYALLNYLGMFQIEDAPGHHKYHGIIADIAIVLVSLFHGTIKNPSMTLQHFQSCRFSTQHREFHNIKPELYKGIVAKKRAGRPSKDTPHDETIAEMAQLLLWLVNVDKGVETLATIVETLKEDDLKSVHNCVVMTYHIAAKSDLEFFSTVTDFLRLKAPKTGPLGRKQKAVHNTSKGIVAVRLLHVLSAFDQTAMEVMNGLSFEALDNPILPRIEEMVEKEPKITLGKVVVKLYPYFILHAVTGDYKESFVDSSIQTLTNAKEILTENSRDLHLAASDVTNNPATCSPLFNFFTTKRMTPGYVAENMFVTNYIRETNLQVDTLGTRLTNLIASRKSPSSMMQSPPAKRQKLNNSTRGISDAYEHFNNCNKYVFSW